MTVLDLRPDCIAHTNRLDVAMLGAMMIWPDDDLARILWIRAAALVELADFIDELPIDLLRQYAKDAMRLPRIGELKQSTKKRFTFGMIAGTVVLQATVLAHIAPEKAALHKVRKEISERLWRFHKISPTSMKNTDGPIAPFRPVAHLWAAYRLGFSSGDKSPLGFSWGDKSPFPCRSADLLWFLTIAEAFRVVAETSRAPKSNTTMMRPGEAVTLPELVLAQLPKMAIEVAPPRCTETDP